MAQSPDGNTVVSAAADETLRFWKCFSDDAASGSKTKKAKESADGSVLRRFAFR
jgi:cell division cycle protein 20 (cofactor of APC complex)